MPLPHDVWIGKLRGLIDLGSDDEQAIRSLRGHTWLVHHHRDILTRSKRPDFLYVIVSGWAARYDVRLDGSRRITAFMAPGDFCGVHAVTGGVMDHSIVAITDCEVGAFPAAEVERLVAERPLILKALWRAKLIDEAILRQWLLSSGDALQAIARMLCELNARAEAAGLCKDGTCHVPITQSQLGDAAGITAVHTNRTLKKLRSDGQIYFSAGNLKILDPDQLLATAQWYDRYLKPWDVQR